MNDRKIVAIYLIGTFGITYLAWWIIVLANQVGYLKAGTVAFWPVYIIGGLASTLMGIILAIKTERNSSVLSVMRTAFNIKQPIKFYGLILMFFILSFGFPSEFGKWYIGIIYVFYMIFFGGLEEIGWRYIFQPTLEKHLPFWLASAITAILWAVWHLPLFFIDGMNKGSDFSMFVLGVLGMSFMLGAIYRISSSLWLCVLFHGMINAFSQVWKSPTYVNNEFVSSLIQTMIKISISVILVYLADIRKSVKLD
ncbi:MAG TPA: CPBP family intramembrane metalloprotease [Clostridiales bacterium]|nr:CPBP family intramembrane metalloprotease [Clostridiales bacterium]